MSEELRLVLVPYYLHFKFAHIVCMAAWFMSTSVAYLWFVRVAYLQAERHPQDPELQRRREWAMQQFADGALLEHVAFVLLIATGAMMYWLSGWTLGLNWLGLKVAIVALVFVPMEVFDLGLSHLGGNKALLRAGGDEGRRQRLMRWHWQLLRLSTPLVLIFIPALIFLAVFKPL